MMKKILNLTPHAVSFVAEDGSLLMKVEPSGQVARCKTETRVVAQVEVDGILIPETETVFGDVEGLPDPEEGVIYLVSSLVAQAAKRDDVVIPNESVRDAEGRIIGCRSLGRI